VTFLPGTFFQAPGKKGKKTLNLVDYTLDDNKRVYDLYGKKKG